MIHEILLSKRTTLPWGATDMPPMPRAFRQTSFAAGKFGYMICILFAGYLPNETATEYEQIILAMDSTVRQHRCGACETVASNRRIRASITLVLSRCPLEQ